MVQPVNQEQLNEKEWENPENWKLGIFYYSHKDTRFWVPKRSMMGRRRYGGTPNMAKKGARTYMMLILGGMLLLLLLVMALERSGVI